MADGCHFGKSKNAISHSQQQVDRFWWNLAWWWILAPISGEVQICIWPSWCHCHSLSLASVKSRLVLPFWYCLTRVIWTKFRAVKWLFMCVFIKWTDMYNYENQYRCYLTVHLACKSYLLSIKNKPKNNSTVEKGRCIIMIEKSHQLGCTDYWSNISLLWLWTLTLTFERDRDIFKENQCAKYIGQTSFKMKVVWTHRHIN